MGSPVPKNASTLAGPLAGREQSRIRAEVSLRERPCQRPASGPASDCNCSFSADVTQNDEHGIRGAQATAAAILVARTGSSKEEIRRYTEEASGYFLDESLAGIRFTYTFDVSCQGSVP